MRNKISLFVLTTLVLSVLWGCSEKKDNLLNPNQPPETGLFLSFPDTLPDSLAMPDTSTSTKIIFWYGDDIDGEVAGFYHAWDDTSSDTAWTYTEENMDTFYVPIREAYGEFTFYVRAVDNEGDVDPTPAYVTFPIINSPPSMNFPVDFVQNYSSEDFVSFTRMTFGWSGRDPDGDETIVKYEYYLGDDTTPVDSASFDTLGWQDLPVSPTQLTLTDITPGEHRVFFRATDIAGAKSEVIYYPDTTGSWTVQAPVGDVLYVDDNDYFYQNESVYFDVLNSLYGEGNYSSWNIEERTYYDPSDMIEVFSFFDIIIWNSGSYPHFNESQAALNSFIYGGGKLSVSTTYAGEDTTIFGFLPIDSVTQTNIVRPWDFYSQNSNYRNLEPSQPVSFTFGFEPACPEFFKTEPDTSVALLYRVADSTDGEICGVKWPAQDPRVILFSFTIHECQVDSGFQWLLPYILTEEF
ncbi:MAG: hypothetical protein GF307_12860 [candidate division Zixibacteria bacterium]|nr:hypothetical protein [candidate division Zixibacteria bacterium]